MFDQKLDLLDKRIDKIEIIIDELKNNLVNIKKTVELHDENITIVNEKQSQQIESMSLLSNTLEKTMSRVNYLDNNNYSEKKMLVILILVICIFIYLILSIF